MSAAAQSGNASAIAAISVAVKCEKRPEPKDRGRDEGTGRLSDFRSVLREFRFRKSDLRAGERKRSVVKRLKTSGKSSSATTVASGEESSRGAGACWSFIVQAPME